MDVTRDNFSKAYSILEKSLDAAEFIAIDGEFTGLSTIKQGRPGYDTLEERYLKTRMGSGKILLVQYGICLFTWKEEEGHYEAMPFTFYIFPRPYKRYGNDICFMSQSSSLDFLANNGFDFNKLFYKGISFMNPIEEERARGRIERDMAYLVQKEQTSVLKSPSDEQLPLNESKVFIPKDQREFIEGICETVFTFMEDDDRVAVDLPPSTPFQRKLIYEKLEEKYPLGLYLASATNENDEKFIRGHKTAMGLKKVHEEKRQHEEKMLAEIVGFTNVMKLVSKSKKPIVGHNMLLDLFLTITNFFSPPPLCLRDFKELMNSLFPVIFDTKLIASTPPLNHVVSNTGLQSLGECIENDTLPKPNVVISEKLKEEVEYCEQYHQAGYDAYCTGRLFVSLTKCVLSCLTEPSNRIDLSCDLLNRYINRIFILGIRDINFTDLSGEDSTPDRHDVFYIRFPVTWTQAHIEDLFTSFCSLSYPINWINEESAFVTIANKEKYDDVFVNLVMNSESKRTFYVLPYNDYINNKDPRSRVSKEKETVPVKRKRSHSDVEDGEISSGNESVEKEA